MQTNSVMIGATLGNNGNLLLIVSSYQSWILEKKKMKPSLQCACQKSNPTYQGIFSEEAADMEESASTIHCIQSAEWQYRLYYAYLLLVHVTFISATREENKLCVTSLSISFLFTLLSATPGARPP